MARDNSFDWFSLDRLSLFGILYSIEDRVVNQKLTVEQLHTKLTSQIRKFLPVKTRRSKQTCVEKGWVYVGGAYYSDLDQDLEKAIEIEFSYNPTDKAITLSSRRFSRMCLSFADTVLHEIIHMRQHRRRNFKIIPDYPSTANRQKQREEQRYLGCRDEIDAYAFNIACELNDKFNGKINKVLKYLNTAQASTYYRRNCSYEMYLKAFGHDHNHPVIKRVKKKVISYWPQSYYGKPYRNSEWINY